MEKLYFKDIRVLPDPKAKHSVICNLPKARQEKCLGYINSADRKRSLGAGIIINEILTEFNGRLIEGLNGKPESNEIYFNISHSGDYVIGVASDVPVGCDIEKMESAPIEIADRYFYADEKDYILNHSDRDFAFWQMWTLKESYMKMTGEGMQLPLDSFCVAVDSKIRVYRKGIEQECSLRYFIHDGHLISVCKEKGFNGY